MLRWHHAVLRYQYGETGLMMATYWAQTDMIRFLLAQGADAGMMALVRLRRPRRTNTCML